MNAHKVIAAEETVVVAVLAGKDLVNQAMPRPKPILAALLFYGALGWVSALGAQAARLSAAVGGVIALALLVAPAGAKFVSTLQRLVQGVESTAAPQGSPVDQFPGVVRSPVLGPIPGAGGELRPPSKSNPAAPGGREAPGMTRGVRSRNTEAVPGGTLA